MSELEFRPMLVNCRAAARILGLSLDSLATMRSRKIGPKFVRIGRHIRYRIADLEAWAEENKVATGGLEERST